ncbi:MAG: WXG100 family type VII secretion target [Chloroflexota bacterium]|nr:WXG100 family type VII secretion target [Chloroflexota bacterium]
MSLNGDMTGGRTHVMDATASNFLQRLSEFETALSNINSAVSALEADWFGRGSASYQNAMNKWHRDAQIVYQDLHELTHGLQMSSTALTDLDSQMARAFAGFGG